MYVVKLYDCPGFENLVKIIFGFAQSSFKFAFGNQL